MSVVHFNRQGAVCLLRLNAPPVNALTFDLLEELRGALRRAQADPLVQAVLITGDTRHFSAGADVSLFKKIACADDAVRISRTFQEAFQEVEDSGKPVAAAVAGQVMGGALELAMACHFRVAARQSRFSMPEVTLGVNPGAGGTQRLPRLIGTGPALKMLLTGRAIGADQALQSGLVDLISAEEDLVQRTVDLLQSGKPILRTRDRLDKVPSGAARETAFAEAQTLLARVRPELIAPFRITEAVRTGLSESFAAGLRSEQNSFAACMNTQATQNKIHLFFATRETARIPALADIPASRVAKAGVVGMGAMGTGIAQALILAGLPVVALDQNPTALSAGCQRIRSSIEKRVADKKCSPARAETMLGLLRTTMKWQDLAGLDLVVEAVFEDVPTKRAALAAIEGVCSGRTIIASNTSTISLDVLAQGMQKADRFVGLHFFNPAHRMPLVEVIQGKAVAPEVLATALRFAKSLRKTPVLVKNREGFVVSRLFVPYVKEAFLLLEEGADAQAVDQAMVQFGFPMGPFLLIDMTGLDILAMTDRILTRAFPHQGPLPAMAARLVDEGHWGQKTGSGVYRYEKGDRQPQENPITRQILSSVRQVNGIHPREVPGRDITERLLLRMIGEALRLMEDGVVQHESDIDVATVLGLGFPDFRGGVLKYARDCPLDKVQSQLEELTARCGNRFEPCEWLRNRKGDG